MKKNVVLLIIAIVLGVLSVAGSCVVAGILGFDKVFASDVVHSAIDCFKFQNIDQTTLIVTISFALAIVFFIVLLVLLIVKKRPLALIGLFLCVLGLSLGAYGFAADHLLVAEPPLLHVIPL